MRREACNAIGCRAAILKTEVFCERHLKMVESDTLRVLARTFRPDRKPNAVFSATLERARTEILNMATHGYRAPRDRPFQWDEGETSK